jgi:hypothetical protein
MSINRIRQISTHSTKKVEKRFVINNEFYIELKTGHVYPNKTIPLSTYGNSLGTFWELPSGKYAIVHDPNMNILTLEDLENINNKEDITEKNVFYYEVDSLLDVAHFFLTEEDYPVESLKLVVDQVMTTIEREDFVLQ